jgi:hypothetical protein
LTSVQTYAVNLGERKQMLAPILLEKIVPDASKPEGHIALGSS